MTCCPPRHRFIKRTESEGGSLSGINMNAIGGAAAQLRQLAKAREKPLAIEGGDSEDKPVASTSKATDPPPLPKKATTSTATPYNAAAYSTGRSAASLTSTAADIAVKSERALIDEEEYMYEQIRDKSYGAFALILPPVATA